MSKDSIRLDAPAAQVELEWLKSLKVGDVRKSPLMPAIDSDLEWVCRVVAENRWEFDVLFFGQRLFEATFVATATSVTLELKEAA